MKDLEKVAELLDTKFKFAGVRFGYDSIVGLIPLAGDFLTLAPSFYIIVRALSMKASLFVLLRMLLNVAVDTLFGSIPILGNFFDIFWKSNVRNIEILKDFKANPSKAESKSKYYILCAIGLVFAFFIGIVYFVILVGIAVLKFVLQT